MSGQDRLSPREGGEGRISKMSNASDQCGRSRLGSEEGCSWPAQDDLELHHFRADVANRTSHEGFFRKDSNLT